MIIPSCNIWKMGTTEGEKKSILHTKCFFFGMGGGGKGMTVFTVIVDHIVKVANQPLEHL